MWMRMFKKPNEGNGVRAGSVYRRVRRDNTVETATVLAIGDDPFGIPHVRYEVCFGRTDNRIFEADQRVLSLSSFAEHYREPLAS